MDDKPNILVPVRVLEGESIPDGIPELLAGAHIILLGYHEIPDQTAPGQAQMQFEKQAGNRLDDLKELFVKAGASVEKQLVFTHESQKTFDRMIAEHDCNGVLVPNATNPPEDVLVAIRGTVGIDRIIRVVAGLFREMDVNITLFHTTEKRESEEDARTFLEGVADSLIDRGIPADAIDLTIQVDTADAETAIVQAASDFDALIMGESDPSLVTYVFGMRAEQVAKRFLGPVIVVTREKPEKPPATESS